MDISAWSASKYGFLHLQDVAKEELSSMPSFSLPIFNSHLNKSIDLISQTYLQQCDIQNFGIPISVSGNGSCLFNSVSMSLSGSQELSTELRVRTCIEMVIRKERYTSLPISNKLICVSPNYVSSTLDCATKNGWSSIWTIFALSEVIGVPIESVYLPLNGVQDMSYKVLNLLAVPRTSLRDNFKVTVMWTRSTYHNPKQIWIPNHFVPLLDIQPDDSMYSITPDPESLTDFPPLSLNQNTLQSFLSQETSGSISESEKSSTPPEKLTNQLSGNLTATAAFKAIVDSDTTCQPKIPNGKKENVFFLIDNSANQLRATKQFADDCGAWDSHSGRTVKTTFIVQNDDTLRFTCLKDEQYCFEKQIKGKKTLIPFTPQPEGDAVITLTRYYTPLKRDKSFKKRVSFFNRLPTRFSHRQHIALVEYTGSYPESNEPHGNAKHVQHEYVRTDPSVFEKIKDNIRDKKSNLEIYKEMVFENPENAPRDIQQISSKKYHDKKHSIKSSANIADQVLEALAMVNNNEFVQEAVYTNGNNKPPSIICYTPSQFEDMKLHVENDKNCILGVDRTFNLGPVYVTNLVYKNKKVVKKSSRDHPIFVGPTFFHWDASFYTYHTFFSHVKARLHGDVQCLDIRIGSDDEGGLTKAIDNVFPNAVRLLCTKHLKDNVADYTKNKLPLTKTERNNIMETLFDPDGIVDVADIQTFNAFNKKVMYTDDIDN